MQKVFLGKEMHGVDGFGGEAQGNRGATKKTESEAEAGDQGQGGRDAGPDPLAVLSAKQAKLARQLQYSQNRNYVSTKGRQRLAPSARLKRANKADVVAVRGIRTAVDPGDEVLGTLAPAPVVDPGDEVEVQAQRVAYAREQAQLQKRGLALEKFASERLIRRGMSASDVGQGFRYLTALDGELGGGKAAGVGAGQGGDARTKKAAARQAALGGRVGGGGGAVAAENPFFGRRRVQGDGEGDGQEGAYAAYDAYDPPSRATSGSSADADSAGWGRGVSVVNADVDGQGEYASYADGAGPAFPGSGAGAGAEGGGSARLLGETTPLSWSLETHLKIGPK